MVEAFWLVVQAVGLLYAFGGSERMLRGNDMILRWRSRMVGRFEFRIRRRPLLVYRTPDRMLGIPTMMRRASTAIHRTQARLVS